MKVIKRDGRVVDYNKETRKKCRLKEQLMKK